MLFVDFVFEFYFFVENAGLDDEVPVLWGIASVLLVLYFTWCVVIVKIRCWLLVGVKCLCDHLQRGLYRIIISVLVFVPFVG